MMRSGWIGATSEVPSLAPLLRGEGWGEGLSPRAEPVQSLLQKFANANFDLSLQAGRGDIDGPVPAKSIAI
jgi:hypothetical protein